MTPDWEIRQGGALQLLGQMPEASVQCVVTSPPYWGLRDYGTATWEGGDPACKHAGRPKPRQDTHGQRDENHGRFATTRGTQASKAIHSIPVRGGCRCGARRVDEQLGLERTPEEYVARMVEVFREVRRVLRGDGTLWLNLGDSYATGAGKVGERPGGGAQGDAWAERGATTSPNRMPIPGLKPKDLVGIPWRVAFALQAEGWWLRSDIVWAKPNPMPESVTDRPTKAHEYLFLLAKAERYHYDGDAVREPRIREDQVGVSGWAAGPGDHSTVGHNRDKGDAKTFRGGQYVGGNKFDNSHATARSSHGNTVPLKAGRNRRTVWTVATQPFPEAHFATMPEALVEPCVLAGSRPGDMVLDPFAGSGTVGVVAMRHGRRFLGLELNAEYCTMARRRIGGPLFALERV